MSEPLRLTIVYEDAADGDGWVVARIPQVRGAISQGQPAARFDSPPELSDRTGSDSLELSSRPEVDDGRIAASR